MKNETAGIDAQQTISRLTATMGVIVLILIATFCSGCVDLAVTAKLHRTPKTREEWSQVGWNAESKSNFTSVAFNSRPQGATISIANVFAGTTPVSADLPDKTDTEERVFETYRAETKFNSQWLGVIDTILLLPLIYDISVMNQYQKSGDVFSDGHGGWIFPEKILSRTSTGQFREIVKPDERRVEFHFEDLLGEKTLHLPDDNKIEFDFGEVRKARTVKCQLLLGVVDACIGVVEPKDASIEQLGGSLFVYPPELEQDGIGRWWFNGEQLENAKLPIKLVRTAGQWIPPTEPVVVDLPQKYTAGSVDVAADVPLKAVPWFWTHHTNWPAIDGTVMTEEQRESLKSSLNDTWSGRRTNGINPYTAVFSGLMLRALFRDERQCAIARGTS